MRLIPCLLAVMMLAGCGGVSDIVKVGKDTYMISSSGSSPGDTGGMQKARLYQAAGEYCEKQGKLVMPVSWESDDGMIGRRPTAEITFMCLLESDPAYQRPKFKPNPTALIEMVPK